MPKAKKRQELRELAQKLRMLASLHSAPIWKRAALELLRPRRLRREVNLSRLNRETAQNDVVLVLGKVLASGELGHALKIAAFWCSQAARKKIEAAGGQLIPVLELASQLPKGTGVKIIG